jgi:hypothetical protein
MQWRAKDAADLAAKHIVGEGLVATQVSITSADLGKDKNAVHIKGARDCVFTIDPNVRCAKLFIEDCTRCEVKVDGPHRHAVRGGLELRRLLNGRDDTAVHDTSRRVRGSAPAV